MSVSVIIPARNEEKTIGKTMRAALAIHPARVVVCIDSATADETYKEAMKWPEYFEKVVVLNNTGPGKGQCVKAALNHVRTDRVILLDADITGWGDPDRAMQCLNSTIAEMIIVVPAMPTPTELRGFSPDIQERVIAAWPHVSGLRSVPTQLLKPIDLHGYLMETQINLEAKRQGLSVWYEWADHLHNPFNRSVTRLRDMERDREWGIQHGILEAPYKGTSQIRNSDINGCGYDGNSAQCDP